MGEWKLKYFIGFFERVIQMRLYVDVDESEGMGMISFLVCMKVQMRDHQRDVMVYMCVFNGDRCGENSGMHV